jgi:hypothetical protein
MKHEREFELMCGSMEEAGVKDIDKMTVFEFYSRVIYFDKKSKAK